jgi:hypothetical protein
MPLTDKKSSLYPSDQVPDGYQIPIPELPSLLPTLFSYRFSSRYIKTQDTRARVDWAVFTVLTVDCSFHRGLVFLCSGASRGDGVWNPRESNETDRRMQMEIRNFERHTCSARHWQPQIRARMEDSLFLREPQRTAFRLWCYMQSYPLSQ